MISAYCLVQDKGEKHSYKVQFVVLMPESTKSDTTPMLFSTQCSLPPRNESGYHLC